MENNYNVQNCGIINNTSYFNCLNMVNNKKVKHALRQQIKRRKKNTTIAAGNTQLINRIVNAYPSNICSDCPTSGINNQMAIESAVTMKEVLASLPGFSIKSNKRRSIKRLSVAAQLEAGLIDLESPASILAYTSLRALLNRHTFQTLPLLYQRKLAQLLPAVDRQDASISGLNNEFFTRACQEWRKRLSEGEFTPENQHRLKLEAERDKNKLDPWKLKHFEPIWEEKREIFMLQCGLNSLNGDQKFPDSVTFSELQSHSESQLEIDIGDLQMTNNSLLELRTENIELSISRTNFEETNPETIIQQSDKTYNVSDRLLEVVRKGNEKKILFEEEDRIKENYEDEEVNDIEMDYQDVEDDENDSDNITDVDSDDENDDTDNINDSYDSKDGSSDCYIDDDTLAKLDYIEDHIYDVNCSHNNFNATKSDDTINYQNNIDKDICFNNDYDNDADYDDDNNGDEDDDINNGDCGDDYPNEDNNDDDNDDDDNDEDDDDDDNNLFENDVDNDDDDDSDGDDELKDCSMNDANLDNKNSDYDFNDSLDDKKYNENNSSDCEDFEIYNNHDKSNIEIDKNVDSSNTGIQDNEVEHNKTDINIRKKKKNSVNHTIIDIEKNKTHIHTAINHFNFENFYNSNNNPVFNLFMKTKISIIYLNDELQHCKALIHPNTRKKTPSERKKYYFGLPFLEEPLSSKNYESINILNVEETNFFIDDKEQTKTEKVESNLSLRPNHFKYVYHVTDNTNSSGSMKELTSKYDDELDIVCQQPFIEKSYSDNSKCKFLYKDKLHHSDIDIETNKKVQEEFQEALKKISHCSEEIIYPSLDMEMISNDIKIAEKPLDIIINVENKSTHCDNTKNQDEALQEANNYVCSEMLESDWVSKKSQNIILNDKEECHWPFITNTSSDINETNVIITTMNDSQECRPLMNKKILHSKSTLRNENDEIFEQSRHHTSPASRLCSEAVQISNPISSCLMKNIHTTQSSSVITFPQLQTIRFVQTNFQATLEHNTPDTTTKDSSISTYIQSSSNVQQNQLHGAQNTTFRSQSDVLHNELNNDSESKNETHNIISESLIQQNMHTQSTVLFQQQALLPLASQQLITTLKPMKSQQQSFYPMVMSIPPKNNRSLGTQNTNRTPRIVNKEQNQYRSRGISKEPLGAVNFERSYQICQAVIASSPNRDQLKAHLKPPPSFLTKHEKLSGNQKSCSQNHTDVSKNWYSNQDGILQNKSQSMMFQHIISMSRQNSNEVTENYSVNKVESNNFENYEKYVFSNRTESSDSIPRASSAPPIPPKIINASSINFILGRPASVGEKPQEENSLTNKSYNFQIAEKSFSDIARSFHEDHLSFICKCSIREAMIICRQCGAFCHDECITPQYICTICLLE